MEWISEIGQFLWAVLNNWAGYSTGGIIVAVVALWHVLKNQPMPRKLAIALAMFFFFLSFFKAWQDQYHRANDLQSSLHAAPQTIQVNIPPINVPPAQVIINQPKGQNVGAERLPHIFLVEAHDAGNLTVKHGAGCKPSRVSWEMTSGGNFWLQKPTSYDETNVYFVASGEGITAKVLVWCP
jgi:hypothetical protein